MYQQGQQQQQWPQMPQQQQQMLQSPWASGPSQQGQQSGGGGQLSQQPQTRVFMQPSVGHNPSQQSYQQQLLQQMQGSGSQPQFVGSLGQLPLQSQGPMTVQVPSQQTIIMSPEYQQQQLQMQQSQKGYKQSQVQQSPQNGSEFTVYVLKGSDSNSAKMIFALQNDPSLLQMVQSGRISIVYISRDHDENTPRWLTDVPSMMVNSTGETVINQTNILSRIKMYLEQYQMLERQSQQEMQLGQGQYQLGQQLGQQQQFVQPGPQSQYQQGQYPQSQLAAQLAPQTYGPSVQARDEFVSRQMQSYLPQGPQMPQGQGLQMQSGPLGPSGGQQFLPQQLVGPSMSQPVFMPSAPVPMPLGGLSSSGFNPAQSGPASVLGPPQYDKKYVQVGGGIQTKKVASASSLYDDTDSSSIYSQRYSSIASSLGDPNTVKQQFQFPQGQGSAQGFAQGQGSSQGFAQGQGPFNSQSASPYGQRSQPGGQSGQSMQDPVQQQLYQSLAQSGFPVNSSTAMSPY